MDKPRIRRVFNLWYCYTASTCGLGNTPKAAYRDWYQAWTVQQSIKRMWNMGIGYVAPEPGGNPYAN